MIVENFPSEVTSSFPFQLYIVFKQFCKVSFQAEISEAELKTLSENITEVHRLIKTIDSSYSIFPKLHQLRFVKCSKKQIFII